MPKTNPLVEIHTLLTTFDAAKAERYELLDRLYAIREVVVEALEDEVKGA
jgi:hypothetical protein